MGRAITVALLFILVLLRIHLAEAQQAKLPTIGYVSANEESAPGPLVEAFRQGLRDLGYIDRKNVVVEYRWAGGKDEAMPKLVEELLQLKVDVLVAPVLAAIRAAKQLTKTTPVVMIASEDPVLIGLVNSLAHPGGNITGLNRLQRQLSGKRLELMNEAVPRLSRVGVLLDGDSQTAEIGFREYEASAPSMKIEVQALRVRGPSPEFERTYRTGGEGTSEWAHYDYEHADISASKGNRRFCIKESTAVAVRGKHLGGGRRTLVVFDQ